MAAPASAGVPSKRAQRYDRQLRLWGDHGQDALYNASICCIGSSAVGCEILKNLVLPGIGGFTIVDKAVVTAEDCGSNFFVSVEEIGKPRAQVTSEMLKEMNAEVKGEWVEDDAATILKTNPGFFKQFTVVVATLLPDAVVKELAALLWDANIPLLVAQAYGMLGYMRLAVREHCVVESHTSDATSAEDLRLMAPFPELVEFCQGFNLQTMENKDYTHTPYAVVLYQFLEQWKAKNGGVAPKVYKEKRAFRDELQASIRINTTTGVAIDAENFGEAVKAVNTALNAVEVPSTIKALVTRPEATSLTDKSDKFWILVNALGVFIEANGMPPMRGAIPDMTAESDTYVALQRIYRKKAADDIAAITTSVTNTLESLGKPVDFISATEIKTFCKNAGSITMVSTTNIVDEWSAEGVKRESVEQMLENQDDDIHWYLLLRAADKFKTQHGHYPGHFDEQVEEDMPRLKESVATLLEELKIGSAVREDCISELCRYGAAELHNVAAFIGGAAAHEVVKLTTRQYIPFNNTYVFNGMTGSATTIDL
jgi:amyloid beta precursor protein binding protein 1